MQTDCSPRYAVLFTGVPPELCPAKVVRYRLGTYKARRAFAVSDAEANVLDWLIKELELILETKERELT